MKIEDIKNEDIVYFGERIEPYFASSIIIRAMIDSKNLSKVLELKNGVRWIYTNNYFFMIKKDIEDMEINLKKKLKRKGKNYVKSLVKKCFLYGNNLIKTSKTIKKETKDGIDIKKMYELLNKYSIASSNYMIFQNIALFEKPLDEIAKELVKKYTKTQEEFNNLFNLITTGSDITSVEKEQDEFLKLRINDKLILVEKHTHKFGWLSLRFFVGEPWKTKDVMERLKHLDIEKAKEEFSNRINHRKEREKEIKAAIKEFNKEDKEIVMLIRDIVYLRTQRTDFFQESSYYIQPLLYKIAKEFNVSYYDLLYLSINEVLLSLKGKFDYQKCINKRKEGFLVFFDKDKDRILESFDAIELIKKIPILNREENTKINEFSGNIGYKGHAIGRVKIIKSDKDNSKFVKGDILVSVMTTPNFIPAMEKSIAFITDEGGITSHAAIIAREMKKPCIIGTKIATKVLHDGDLVEVDAENGVVKVLKRAGE